MDFLSGLQLLCYLGYQKKTCARFKKNTWLFGGLNSCVFMLENTRVLFLHKTHECGVDKPLQNCIIVALSFSKSWSKHWNNSNDSWRHVNPDPNIEFLWPSNVQTIRIERF